MIEICVGNLGSGKTATKVKEIVQNKDGRTTFSNIIMPKVKNNKLITADMIMKKGLDDKGKETYELNKEFWRGALKKHKSINICIDEAHTLVNSRRSLSRKNVLMTEFLSLLRKLSNGGNLTLITQLVQKLDGNFRDMATMVKLHKCHYVVKCEECYFEYPEDNEVPEKITYCPRCESHKLTKHSFLIEVWSFKNINDFEMFQMFGNKNYFSHKVITDIEEYFPFYDTYQWENLLSDI